MLEDPAGDRRGVLLEGDRRRYGGSDDEITEIRDSLYVLVRMMFDDVLPW